MLDIRMREIAIAVLLLVGLCFAAVGVLGQGQVSNPGQGHTISNNRAEVEMRSKVDQFGGRKTAVDRSERIALSRAFIEAGTRNDKHSFRLWRDVVREELRGGDYSAAGVAYGDMLIAAAKKPGLLGVSVPSFPVDRLSVSERALLGRRLRQAPRIQGEYREWLLKQADRIDGKLSVAQQYQKDWLAGGETVRERMLVDAVARYDGAVLDEYALGERPSFLMAAGGWMHGRDESESGQLAGMAANCEVVHLLGDSPADVVALDGAAKTGRWLIVVLDGPEYCSALSLVEMLGRHRHRVLCFVAGYHRLSALKRVPSLALQGDMPGSVLDVDYAGAAAYLRDVVLILRRVAPGVKVLGGCSMDLRTLGLWTSAMDWKPDGWMVGGFPGSGVMWADVDRSWLNAVDRGLWAPRLFHLKSLSVDQEFFADEGFDVAMGKVLSGARGIDALGVIVTRGDSHKVLRSKKRGQYKGLKSEQPERVKPERGVGVGRDVPAIVRGLIYK